MSYNESNVAITTDSYFSSAGYVTKQYLIDAYPQLSDQAKSAGLWTWGRNTGGQLGNNTSGAGTEQSSPVQTLAGGTNWKLVSAGYYHTAAIKTDGTLWLWGKNNYGQLGDNTLVGKSTPVQTISGGTNWKLVSNGQYYTAAIKTDGTLWLWGQTSYGVFGNNDSGIRNYSSPIQTIAGGTNWKKVSTGRFHIGAIKTDGTLWTWGYNLNGQLGDNTTTPKSSPVQTIAGGTNWKSVSATTISNNMGAIKTDGTLWTWGNNSAGQLGDNTVTQRNSPVQTVSGGTNWSSFNMSSYMAAAIKTDGTLWLWGQNTYGVLGDNTVVSKSSPVQTISGGTNWKSVTGGLFFSGAIKTDGTLWTWGNNNFGQLGDNTVAIKSSPVQTVAGGTNWKSISINRHYVSAIKDFNEDF